MASIRHGTRVTIANPAAPKRARRKRKVTEMAAKKKRRRARKAKTNPKRAHARKKRRASRANPRRRRVHARRARSNPRRRRSHRRARRANPRRRRRVHARSHRANPRRRTRRHRRNPGGPLVTAALAAALGILGFAATTAGATAITQRTDPSYASIDRNRYIMTAVVAAAGLFLLSKKNPLLGVGLAAGALAGGLGYKVAQAATTALTPKASASTQASLNAVYAMNALAAQNMNAVYAMNGLTPQNLGAVYAMNALAPQNLMGMGSMGNASEFQPSAPWASSLSPFG